MAMAMAAYFCNRPLIVGKLLETCKIILGGVRNAGNRPKPRIRKRPFQYGIKVQSGQEVRRRFVLNRQCHFKFCPGLNVGIGGRGTFFSTVNGKVYVTSEKADLDYENHIVQSWQGTKGPAIYKKYFNVIPFPKHNRFKLLDKI